MVMQRTGIPSVESATAPSTNRVRHPSHYNTHPSGIETIDIVRHESFLRGNILKYILRAPYKGDELQDLLKAQEYLGWEIDRLRAERSRDEEASKRLAALQSAPPGQ